MRTRFLALLTAVLFATSVTAACSRDKPGAVPIPGPGVDLEHEELPEPKAPPSTIPPDAIARDLSPQAPPTEAPQDEEDPAKPHAPPGASTEELKEGAKEGALKTDEEARAEYGLLGEVQLIQSSGPRVVIQKGHAFRRKGATGTRREQEAVSAIGDRMGTRLANRGYRVTIVLADEGIPASDAFVALHTDGSANASRRGASVGYPDATGGELARAWKAAHQAVAGYNGGFLNDNYTTALRKYYGFGRSRARFEFLAEHATTTNGEDERFVFSNLDRIADAHVVALDTVFARRGAAPVIAPPPPPRPPAAVRPAPRRPAPPPRRAPVLRRGSRGAGVVRLQAALRRRGYRIRGPARFGPQTERAVRAFQRRNGLKVDGIVGPATRRRLGV